jgi:hypothetical protein
MGLPPTTSLQSKHQGFFGVESDRFSRPSWLAFRTDDVEDVDEWLLYKRSPKR